MKDNDIKMYFENAVEANEDTGIEPEKIKNRVMAELGKTAVANLTNPQNGEEVTPVFVKAPARKFPKAKVITAAATAACLGVVSVSTGFFGLVGGGESPLSNPGTSQGETVLKEETAEDAYAEYLKRKEATTWTYNLDQTYSEPGYGNLVNLSYLLSAEEGRVYFIKRADQPNALLDAPKEDITDLISYEDYYIYPYENPYTKSTHYIIAGGSVPDNDYGYADFYKTDDGWTWFGYCSGDGFPLIGSITDVTSEECARMNWLLNGMKEVEKITGETIFGYISENSPIGNFSNNGWSGGEDFKNVSAKLEMPFGVRLLDGTTRFPSVQNGLTDPEECMQPYPLSEEEGKLYFVKNAGDIDLDRKEEAVKEDVTDKISSDNCYIYAYNNYYNKEYHTHYIIIGGDIANNNYGYAELYKVKGRWEYSGAASKYPAYHKEIDNPTGGMWLTNGINELEKNYGEKIIGFQGGGAMQIFNFKNLWATNGEDKDPLQYEDGEEAAPILLNSDNFTLLDGTKITIENNSIISDTDMREAIWLLSGDNGRVYFYGNGGKEEDITDIISTGEPYITSYKNGKSGTTHYIVAGGNPAAGSYGYAEMFKVREGEWHYQLVHTTTPDPMNKEKPDWLQQAFKELKDGEECVFRGGAQYVDLDNVLSPTDFTAMKNDFRYGEIYAKKTTALFDSLTPADTTTLYDGSTLKEYTDDKGVTVTLLDRRNAADILTLENGRLFLNLNGEKTDITDKISREEPYIVKAENPYTNSTHYIAIGGEPKENGWGCVEIYKNGQQYSIPLNGYYFRGENWFNNISDNLPADLVNCETKPQVPDHILDKQPTE